MESDLREMIELYVNAMSSLGEKDVLTRKLLKIIQFFDEKPPRVLYKPGLKLPDDFEERYYNWIKEMREFVLKDKQLIKTGILKYISYYD